MPNFTALDMSLPEVATLVAVMVQARDAVSRRSWSHPQELTGEEWWADVLADPRARKRQRRTDLAVKQAFYRLADERREIILVACSKCDWRAAFSRDRLIASHGADYAMPNLLGESYRTHSIRPGSRRACVVSSRTARKADISEAAPGSLTSQRRCPHIAARIARCRFTPSRSPPSTPCSLISGRSPSAGMLSPTSSVSCWVGSMHARSSGASGSGALRYP